MCIRDSSYNGSLNNKVHLFNFALISSLLLPNFQQQSDFINYGCKGTFHKCTAKTDFRVWETLEDVEFFVCDFDQGTAKVYPVKKSQFHMPKEECGINLHLLIFSQESKKNRYSAGSVSYTHLDVYKRQEQTVEKYTMHLCMVPHTTGLYTYMSSLKVALDILNFSI